MAKPELGTKRTCPVTGKKFYDLDKDPVVSPYTGQAYPRSYFDPVVKGKPVPDNEEETEVAATPDLTPLDDVVAAEDSKDPVADDIDIEADIDADDDDTFLATEEEDGDDDVTGLIDGDIEDEDEV